jgi:actin related protein 2/3 complex subunit 1A/1B
VVVLNINRAALDVKWSPDGGKFAVASGAKVVMVCSFDAANDWWISKPSKKHKSTALAVAFHPNGQLLASVATDYRCRVLSAFLEDVDSGGPDGAQFSAGAGGAPLPEVGEVVAEFEQTRAWLNDCAWSPSGSALAFVGHDSLLHVVSWGGAAAAAAAAAAGAADGEPVVQSIKCPTLPGNRVLFLSERLLVTVGHAMNPELFVRGADSGIWAFACHLDRRSEQPAAAKAAASGWASARAHFVSKVNKGQAAASAAEEAWTRHSNAITYLQPFRAAATREPATRAFSTSGLDGRVVVWDVVAMAPPELDLRAAGLVD